MDSGETVVCYLRKEDLGKYVRVKGTTEQCILETNYYIILMEICGCSIIMIKQIL